ncbi:hypothetical protein EB796_009615 [Bugula neritina]|uniref:Cyclodeaminase/cyclohydrolase domain-containing protein n=1 Tax=Bugula neritina TaxID=10212 RepID=A0A7J7K1T5_BUGNE|nr:hypothetical protein EB796_009615 [Bugula neritina]
MVSPLSSLSVKDFVSSVAARTAVPGGGSVAALVGSVGAGLGAMASLLTYGNKKFESLDTQMRKLIPPLYSLSHELVPLVDADSAAFNQFMEAAKMPGKTEQEIEKKEQAKKEALTNAISVPSTLAKKVNTVWPVLKEVSPIVNIQCKSDVQVCVRCLQTAVWGAYYNVMTNIKDVTDEKYKQQVTDDIKGEIKTMEAESAIILDILEKRV